MPSDPRIRITFIVDHPYTGAPHMDDRESRSGPTETLRRELERIVGAPIANTSNYPEKAQVHVLGRDTSKMRTAVVDALIAAGVVCSGPGDVLLRSMEEMRQPEPAPPWTRPCRSVSPPPHLDPEPWECAATSGPLHPDGKPCTRRWTRDGFGGTRFNPRPGDENGRAYSDKREEYP